MEKLSVIKRAPYGRPRYFYNNEATRELFGLFGRNCVSEDKIEGLRKFFEVECAEWAYGDKIGDKIKDTDEKHV